jgi:hypothetical protein
MGTARMLGLALVTLTTFLWGCQRTPAPLTPVSGKVAYKGFTLPGGTIVFTPDSSRGETGPIAFGKINPDGTYHLYTSENPGAPAGWYRVTVTSMAPSAMPSASQSFNPPQSLLPDKYRDPGLSALACEVKANRVNAIDFNLD